MKKEYCLLIISIVFSIILLEFGYRLFLLKQVVPPGIDTENMIVYSTPFWEYNKVSGFDYVKNGRTDLTFFKNGIPSRCLSFSSNSEGNPGGETAVQNPELRVFVFGDSFTFYPHGEHGDITWPKLLQDSLSGKYKKRVQITNYARDGMGVLQMIDFAADQVSSGLQPDLIIIAFITDDLDRQRFWRVRKNQNGRDNVFTTLNREGKMLQGLHVKTTYINSLAKREWCERIKENKNKDDEILKAVKQDFSAIMQNDFRHFGRVVDLFTLNHSYVWNVLVYNDPFNESTFNKFSKISIKNFTQDSLFVKNVEILKKSGVPIVLLHLPQIEEIKLQKYQFSFMQKKIYENLLENSKFPVINIINLDKKIVPETLFMLPEDRHPSMRGLNFFSINVEKALEEYGFLKIQVD